MLAHAEPLLARVKAAQSDVASLVLGEVGQLAIGTFQSFGARILPPVLARFRSLRPAVEVEIRAATDVNELHAAVEAGELDACFSVLPLKEDGPFAVRELMTDPYVLVAPAGGARRASWSPSGIAIATSAPPPTRSSARRRRSAGRGAEHDPPWSCSKSHKPVVG